MYELEEKINIKDMIYEVRGKEVMLDSDLAKLYGCNNGTKDINKAVKRNIERFPGNFYFQLSKQEALEISRFQFGTLNKNGDNRGYNIKYKPYVFTEQGVAMLSSVLRTKDAARVSVNIMNAFVEMRKFINENNAACKPIILLDDIFSELYEIKKNNIIKYFKRDDQIFITTTDIKDISEDLKKSSDIYIVDNGTFNKED